MEGKKKRLLYVIHSVRGQTINSYLFSHFAISFNANGRESQFAETSDILAIIIVNTY